MAFFTGLYKKYKEYFYFFMLRSIGKKSKVLSGKKFIINGARADAHLFEYDYFLATILVSHGAKVYLIIDDGKAKYDSLLTILMESDFSHIRRYAIVRFLVKIFRNRKIRLLGYGTIASKEKIDDTDLNMIDTEKHVMSSLSRYYQGSECVQDQGAEAFKDILRRIRLDSIDSVLVAKWCVNNIKPDGFLTTHAIYSKWGPAFEYMVAHKVPTVVILESGYVGKKIFFSSVPHEIVHSDIRFNTCKNKISLSVEDRSWAIDCLNSRVNISASDNIDYFQKETLETFTRIDKNNTFLMCPNVIWDGNIKDRDFAFTSLQEWIFFTIDFFKNNPSINLVLRCHPSEATRCKGSLKLEKIIETKYKSLAISKNIQIIRSNQNVNTYDLIAKSLAVILYDGMIALESAFLKTPVILCGKGRFFANNIGIDIIDKNQYVSLLNDFKYVTKEYDWNSFYEGSLRYMYDYCRKGNYSLPNYTFAYDGKDRKRLREWFDSNEVKSIITEIRERMMII